MTIDKADVVDEVLRSGVLGSSTHQKILFEYLMDAKYRGTLHKVKAYSIAVDGFGRSEDFDGSVDSIVRVEMFRLRANLREFNQWSSKYQLHLPKASYDIQISEVAEAPDEKTLGSLRNDNKKSIRQLSRSRVMVAAAAALMAVGFGSFFLGQNLNHVHGDSHCSEIVPNVSIANLSRSYDLEHYVDQVLRGAASQFSHIHIVEDSKDCLQATSPGYEIEYSVFQDDLTYRTTLSVFSTADHHLISSENLAGNLHAGIVNTDTSNDELYFDLVTVINDWLKPGGLIHDHAVSAPWRRAESNRDYSCIASMYHSFVSDSDTDYNEALSCLEESYKRGTPLLDNLGGLAASYIAQQKNLHTATIDNPDEAAARILSDIGDRWGQHVETTVAKIYYESERSDYNSQRMRDTLLTAEKKYNSNPIILLEVSKHAGFRLGDWKYAQQISDSVKHLQSERDNSVFFVDAASSLMFEAPEPGLTKCIKAFSENSRLSNLLVNACAIRAKNDAWTSITESNLRRLGLDTDAAKIEFIENRKYDIQFKRAVIAIWQGLPKSVSHQN